MVESIEVKLFKLDELPDNISPPCVPALNKCKEARGQTKILGLCHSHYGYKELARKIGLDPGRVTAQMSGFNHWIFMTDFRYDGVDAYPLLDE